MQVTREKELGPTDRLLHFYTKRLGRITDVAIGVADLRALDATVQRRSHKAMCLPR